MKKHIRLLSSIAAVLVLSAPVIAHATGNQDVRRQKLINKSYDVTADDRLSIDNQFGNVIVSTWDKQQITVDIEISARASTDQRAQDIMNRIDVKDSRDGHDITFKTSVDEIHNGNDKHRSNDNDRSFYIDYVIHMPTSNRLSIENSFGKTEVPAFKGPITLTSKFGSLSAGKLDNVDQIDVEFGKANITAVNNGKIVFKFNKESRIGKVEGNVRISSEFSQNVQLSVADDIQELSVFESYSGVRMVVDKDLSAEFEVHTSFGHFNNESDFDINERKEDQPDYGPHFDKDYSGKAGDGKAHIRIKSSFGTVRLTHNGNNRHDDEDDDSDKDKNKNKDKSGD
ncbi:MAG TPA: hypothetical protein VG605_22720, partial [Puia sp.]|nr:hypothetical protein [Puia sp.]